MNLPNKLTIGRVIAVPFFIVCYLKEWFLAALIIFVLASLTDMLDGKIARKYDLVTNFGKIMDPLADKILVYSAFCLMIADGTVPAWMLIVILAREFLIAGMRTVAASEGRVIAADLSGKIKTVLQMFAVILIMLSFCIRETNVYPYCQAISMVLLWSAVIMTIISGVEYITKNKDVFRS
ncbi:MAG: CDP-diacylglycerol--glycerol-3-phosphate 3-phosphatidyltransferase [Anaerovoracaceae bacterium]